MLEEIRVKHLDGARERQERLQRAKEHKQQDEHEARDLENRLDAWVGQCPLCHVRQHQGCGVDARYPLEQRPDELRDLVVEGSRSITERSAWPIWKLWQVWATTRDLVAVERGRSRNPMLSGGRGGGCCMRARYGRCLRLL